MTSVIMPSLGRAQKSAMTRRMNPIAVCTAIPIAGVWSRKSEEDCRCRRCSRSPPAIALAAARSAAIWPEKELLGDPVEQDERGSE